MESDSSLRFWVECMAWIIAFVSPVIAIGSEWTQDGENPVRMNLGASALNSVPTPFFSLLNVSEESHSLEIHS